MTEGMTRTSDVERNKAPSESSCTTSAFSPSTRHTARRRPTVVRGSYVTLSSSTRRTPPPTVGVLCQAQPNGRDWQSLTLRAPQQLHCQPRGPQPGSPGTRSRCSHMSGRRAVMLPVPSPGSLGAHQRLAVLAYGEELAMPPGHRVTKGPGRPHHDLRAVLPRHAEH